MVQRSVQSQQPYDIAIVDFQMPPGWDGIETIAKIWKTDPDLQIVLCSAHLGQSREEVVQKLGRSEGLSSCLSR